MQSTTYPSFTEAYRLLGDTSSVGAVMDALILNCSIQDTKASTASYGPDSPNQLVKPEQGVSMHTSLTLFRLLTLSCRPNGMVLCKHLCSRIGQVQRHCCSGPDRTAERRHCTALDRTECSPIGYQHRFPRTPERARRRRALRYHSSV
jgi:hypothetical protein